MGSAHFQEFELLRILDEQRLARIKLDPWYLIFKSNVGLSEEGDPYQDLVLFFEPTSRTYAFRVFSRIYRKGQVNSAQEFHELVYHCFSQFNPCLGTMGLTGNLQFSANCLKYALLGSRCPECSTPKAQDGANNPFIKSEPGDDEVQHISGSIASDSLFNCPLCDDKGITRPNYLQHLQKCEGAKELFAAKESLDDMKSEDVSDFLECTMKDEKSDAVEASKEPEVTHSCTFCGKQYTNTMAYAQHLLKVHNDESSVLYVWFDLKGTERRKAITLYAVSKGRFKPEIDWESNKTPEMEKLIEKYSKMLEKLPESATTYKGTPGRKPKPKPPKKEPEPKPGKKKQGSYKHHFTRNADGSRNCNICSKTVSGRHTAGSHLKLHHGYSPDYQCQICQEKFEFPFPLACHMFEGHPEILPYQAKCVICQNQVTFEKDAHSVFTEHCLACFKAMDHQNRYLWKAANPTPPCHICMMEFTNDHRRKNHLIKVHGETPPFQCDECTYWCLYEGQMKSHKQTHMKKRGLMVGPNNESLYTSCHICGKNISGKASSTGFQDHLRTHEEGGPTFPCDHAGCGQIFKSRSTMKRHVVKAHSTDEKYLCKICGIRQPLPALRKHMAQVHGEAQYECKLCGKRLKSADGLTTHMRIHTGENPFSCKMCTYTCKSSATLSAHKKFVHNGGRSLTASPMKMEDGPPPPTQPPEMMASPRMVYPPGQKLPYYMDGSHLQ